MLKCPKFGFIVSKMSENILWFYEWSGDRLGPVSGDEIQSLYRSGKLNGHSLVWRDGLSDWVPFSASDLAVSAGPPPVPGNLSITPPPVPLQREPFVAREARLRSSFQPGIRSSYGRAWALMTANFWPMVGCFALTSLILGVASQFYVPVFFLMYPLMGGLYWYILRRVRGKDGNIDMLFEGFRRQFGTLAVLNLIVVGISVVAFLFIALVVGAIVALVAAGGGEFESRLEEPVIMAVVIGGSLVLLLILSIPLMILGQVGNFATILVLDCELKAGEALSFAWRATKPFIFKFVLFMLVNVFLSFIGLLALYVGMFITGAWATIALVYLYEDAFGDENQV